MARRSLRPVLLVEDDPDIREATAILLEDEGYRVIQAENGRQALESLAQGPRPSLILLDLMMPVMDGAEFLDNLYARPELADLPVVVMTAVHAPAEQRARQVVRKPYAIETLLDAVARHAEPA